jgi:hypothetical protein
MTKWECDASSFLYLDAGERPRELARIDAKGVVTVNELLQIDCLRWLALTWAQYVPGEGFC